MAPYEKKRSQEDHDGKISVSLLNGFEVLDNGMRIQLPNVGARLVAYLALQDRPIGRCAIAGRLWPETTQDKAQASLRSSLWRIRRLHDRIVWSGNECLALQEGVDVDTHVLLAAASQLDSRTGSDDVPSITISRLSCELLPDWYDDWVSFERERFRLMALHALERMSEWYKEQRAFAAAIECALGAVGLEPLRESAHRSLIEAHIAQGNISEVVRQYRFYRDLLAAELGVEPSGQMVALLESAGLRSSVVDAA